MEVHEATEMYMKTILVLKKRLGTVRSIDVANEMGYSKPTISIAMKKFCQEGLITVDESNCIHLWAAAHTIAERIYERHQVLSYILESMGVSEKHALDDACKIEHDISDETFAALKKEYDRLKKEETQK